MELFRGLEGVPAAADGRALALGTFDGVHLGHRRVIASALEWGRSRGVPVCVVTFEPHPLQVLRPDDPPRLLTSTALKADLVAELGVDQLVVISFTPAFASMEAEAFCREVLAERLAARHLSVGENFRFGHGAKGDARMLRDRREFETAIVPLVEGRGGPVSSTHIRELLERGVVALAGELLGAPFQLEGTVVGGDARGRDLGMPTANVATEPGLIVPGRGVYAGTALGHPAAISVGVRPTFESQGELLVEAYLIGFEGDLYGRTLRLGFLDRLRDEVRFDSAAELVEQMRRDVERVREIVSDSC